MLFLCSNMSSAKTWIVFVLTAVNVYVESSEDAQTIYGPNSYSQAYAGNYASSSAYSDAYNGNIEMDMRYLPHLPWIPLYYCRPDEEFNGCINAGCGRWECSQPESGICIDVVPGGCIPGCRCREPLLRTDDGRCVLASQCPPPKCRGPNEFFMCGPACDNVCSELNIRNQTHCDILNIQCNSMCYCIEGHARDANGICIPIEQCPAQFCGENEEYTPYGICQARTCDDLGYPLPCYDPNSGITFNQGPGCVCKPGYVRDCNGKCIPNSQCPSCGGDPNATSGCGTFCTTCDNYGQEVFCKQPCILNGCACRDGYIYDTVNKKCVLPQNCPAKICNKPNEILGCKNACPVRTCASTRFKQLYKCPPPPKNCEQACVCAPGFFRNGNGDCVTRDQCFPNITCGPDEEYNSCANGGCGRWLCSQPGSICINLVEGGCVPGCRCKAPLLRTSDGRCVPSNQCPQPQCGINEEYVQCKDSVCRPQACGDLGFPLGSQQAIANNNQGQTCQQGPGCVCKEGFVRDSNGNCISAEQCPSCGDDPNATTSCGTFCTTCHNYGQEAFCILSCQLNGCACRNGYIYDTVNKKCILPQNCPPKQCTKPNEISGCNNTCPPRTCEAKDRIYECPLLPLTPQPCVQTCICAPGFYRNAAGDCVTKDQCLPLNCRPDEELYGCINAPCGRWECSQPESGICIDVAPGACIPGCKCREPLLRTDDGRCVLASQCPPPKCRGPNEFFMCGPACDNVCSELNIRNQTHCDILNIQCNSMCYCIEGHARDANGICIPIEQCPEQFCGENEEYTPYGICQARTCDDLGYPLPCYDPNSGITFNQGPGCVCKPGYVRDCNGKCIPNSQCSSCGGDPNATSGCGTFCTTCDNYGQEVFCKQPCILNGCACRDGYIYDTVNKKCVLPQNCPAKICNKPNEILGCKNACPVRTCASTRFKQLYKCPPPPKNCEQACVCAPGFFRNGNGDCVTRDQCFPNITCGPDEEYNSCANGGCGRWLCSQPGSICINLVEGGCVPGCRCKAPLLRTSDGRCVPSNQCPQPQCGINEEYVQCKDSVCRPQACGDLGFPLGCQQAIANNNQGQTCQQGPGCVCKEGFVRDSNGNCISAEQCPSCGGDPNATTGCGTFCTTCDNYGQEAFCILSCQLNGCACRNGYIYDTVNKKCVLPQNCPPKQCTKPNEISGCNNTCPPRTCEAKDRKYECPLLPLTPQPCVQTCICAPGFYRNAAGDCVTKDQCPPNIICGPDEEYNGCSNGGCGRWLCSQPAALCIDLIEGGCIPGCRCKAPLLKTSDGRCVPSDQCPQPQCGLNEEYVQCTDSVCRPQKCEELGFPLPCQQAIADSNQACYPGPGCVCKEGFVRDGNGNCISAQQCPSCGGDPNATTGCGTFCTTCDNYRQEVFCILSCQLNGCACRDGYIYDTVNKKCVLPKNCPKKCNKPNEIIGCKNACPPRTCEAKDRVYKCPPRPQLCEPDCVCAPGFYRNAGGYCVTKEQCDQCSGPNEFFSCGGACDNVCSELSIRNQTKCDIINIKCNDKCYCLEGFARDANGICIPIKHCPNPVQCGVNAEFVTQPVCRPETCSDLGFPLPCLDPKSGITASHGPGCVCKVGFVRDNHGKCVSEKQCPSCGGDPNATTGCGTFCETCDNYGQNVPCILICRSNSCACKNGYIYDTLNKKCVLPQNCPAKCSKPNEEWGCQNACPPRVCESIGKDIKCPIVAQVCIPACNCKNGFFRNKAGDCVSKQQCLEPPKCGKNEVYAKAVSCPPQTCLSRLALYNCPPQNATSIAKYECRCKPGFLRNEIDECIPADKCSSCNGKNEIYARSVSCPPQTCASITARYDCSKFKPPAKEFECRCKPGFFRNKINECISTQECGKCTGPNEYYSCGPACDNVCSELSIRNQTNCDIINVKCNDKCYCIKGHARDANGICVPIKDCPPQCGLNEEYVQCIDSVCRPQKCEELGFPLPCQQAIADRNQASYQGPGCVCKEGFVRDGNGNCISAKQCPSCGGDPNATTGCGTFCTTCDNYGQEVFCILSCQLNGCACRDGYIYDTVNKKCVLPKNCPKKCNKSNEIIGCKNACPPRTCEAKDRVYKCPPRPQLCEPDCVCAPGFYRNAGGYCVTKEQCDQCSGPNEFFSCGGACDNVCSELSIRNQTKCDIINIKCNDKCYCLEGFARDANGICIPIKHCPNPVQCGVNAEFVTQPVCRPETCSDLGFPLPCLDPKSGITASHGPGCVCKVGFVRDNHGKCVSEKQCPSCGGDPNATTGCGTFCETCDNYGQNVACILICKPNGCACKNGYIYDTLNKKCVLPQNCPAKCNKPNEEWGCQNTCPPRVCESIGKDIKCPIVAQVCIPACNCKNGFFRNKAGDCVSKQQCLEPPKCGKNEVYAKAVSCPPQTCLSKLALYKCPPQNATSIAKYECRCKPGFLRNEIDECIPAEKCSSCNGKNEIYARSVSCPPQTCASITARYDCSKFKPPTKEFECRCKPGFFRNKINECISTQECGKCTGPNEYYSCGPACDNVCSELSIRNQTNCDIINVKCNDKCYCIKGHARDANGICVPIKDCPPQCGLNEEYVQCTDSVCRPQKCEELGFPLPCQQAIADSNQACYQGPGCVCKEGFVRDGNGNCISAKQCPSCGGDPNATTGCGTFCTTCDNYGQEVFCILSCQLNGCACRDGYIYDTVNKKCVLPKNCPKKCNKPNEIIGCKNACPLRTCEAKDTVHKCPPRPQLCEPDCVCAPGFYRNAGGYCVTKEQCDQCSGPNEFFSCGGACDNVCSELSIRNQTKCDIINIKCNDKCYCLEGFARDANGICIPIKHCPNPVQCGVNAEFVTQPVCRPETCSDLGFPLPCLDPKSGITASHGPGCVCKVGFVRDNHGKCVSEKQCPSCGGDPNATTGCGTFCETCDNYGQNVACILICKPNGCACKNGYIYDTLNKKCVLPQNCPAKCNKPNEEWGCQNTCPPRVCESIGKDIKCPIVAQVCIPACNCKNGFFRNKAGDCVSKQQCLEPPKCGKNEVYAKAVSCPPQTCLSKLALYKCPPQNATSIAKYECRCKPGFLRNEIDECIPAEKCSSCNGKNEIYARSVSCPPQTCASITARYDCSKFKPPTKEFECRCKPGFFRNKINECISTQECGKCTGPNEYYSCGPACDNVCSELSIRNQTNCDIINVKCNDKCYCIKGHARDANGICVPIKDCPPQCGPNQEYVECPDAVCRPKTCDQVGFPVACPDLSSGLSCQSKPCCICSEGYVQHQNGTCIPYSACPSCGGDANAVSGCGVYCNTKCTGNTKICPKICNYNSCDCKPGFLLDTVLNACVLPDKCTCGPNEVFSKCTNRACHRSNCAQLSIPWVCRHTLATPSSPDNFCVPGCECVLGYLRNSNGVCIPQNQCPEAKNQTGSNTNNGDVNAAAQLENGNGVFTSRFLYVAAKNNPGQSVVASPLSVLFLLAQVALFATGVALEQLYALLNLNSPQQIRGTIPPYLISFNSEKNIILRLAERVYGSEKYPFSESFKEVTRNVFLAEAQNLDFSNPKYAAKIINDWIASQTNNLIQNLVPEDSLNADTRLVLTNAIYMRANFSKPFNTENTQPKDFHVSDTKTVTVRMMNQVSRFRYGVMPKSQAQVVEIPYQNENASLLILLPPKTADGMDNLLEEQLGFTSITSVLLNLSYKKVNLSIPSFGTETRTDLKDILEKAGVKQIFKPDSGLSGIFAKPENVSVSYASQLAKITVDEFGAEAAAGNAMVVGVTSVGVIEDPIDFYADRNFLYFLLLRGNPLFCGRYAGPQ